MLRVVITYMMERGRVGNEVVVRPPTVVVVASHGIYVNLCDAICCDSQEESRTGSCCMFEAVRDDG